MIVWYKFWWLDTDRIFHNHTDMSNAATELLMTKNVMSCVPIQYVKNVSNCDIKPNNTFNHLKEMR